VGLPPPGPAPTAFPDPDAYFATQKAIALEETRAALAAAMNNPNDPPPRFALDLTLAPSRAEGRAPPAGLHEADATEENGGFRRGGASSSSSAAAPRRRRASFGGTGPDDPDDRFSADWRRPGTVLALRPRGATSAVPVLALVAGSSAVAERREAGEPRGPCRLWTAKPLVDAGGRRHHYSAEILDGVVARQRAYGSAHAAPKVPFLQALIGAKSATHVRFDDPEDGSSEDGGSEGTARDLTRKKKKKKKKKKRVWTRGGGGVVVGGFDRFELRTPPNPNRNFDRFERGSPRDRPEGVFGGGRQPTTLAAGCLEGRRDFKKR
jgi:hypothetical protein